MNEDGGKTRARAMLGDRVVTTTEMVFAFMCVDDPKLDEKRRELMSIWLRDE